MIYFIGNSPIVPSEGYSLSTIESCLEYFKYHTEIQVDIETEFNNRNRNLLPNPYENKCLSLQLGDYENQYVIDIQAIGNEVQKLKPLFEDPKIIKIFCNAFFDLRYLLHYGFNIKNIYDCFLTEMSLTLGKSMPEGYRGLEQMTLRYAGYQLDKSVRAQIQERGLDDTVIKYASEDVKFMGIIKEKQLQEVIRLDLNNELKLNNRFAITLAKMSLKGFKIDIQAWLDNVKTNKILALEYLNKINKYVVDLGLSEFLNQTGQLDMFETEAQCKINWNSSKQVIPLMKAIGVNTQIRDKKTGKMKDSVDGKHLTRQKNKFDLLPNYLKYKELLKEINTYGEKFITDNICPVTSNVHSEFFPLLATGRTSSSNPNVQNITATDDLGNPSPLRKCFIPRDKDHDLIVADFSQQEPRITAEYSQDPYLIDFILNGDGDSHSLVSTAISSYLLGEEIKVSKSNNPLVPKYNRKIRDIGKTLALGLDYGKTSFSVKDDLETTQEEAQLLIDLLKSKTPKKEEYFKKNISFVKQNGFIRIDKLTNRISYFSQYSEYLELLQIKYEDRTKEQNSRFMKIKGNLERFARNYSIQGSGGSMSKLACIIFEDKLEELNITDPYIVNMIHDEIVVDCHKDLSEQVSKILEESMIKAGTYICKSIPMKVDLFIGENWGVKH